LINDVRMKWPYLEGAGVPCNRADVPPGETWQPEESLLVLGISRDEARTLGRAYGQNAILFGDAGGRLWLLACQPEEQHVFQRWQPGDGPAE
jgi:hypothetical protein